MALKMKKQKKPSKTIIRCQRCHRQLENEQSKKRGFGDYCWQKVQTHNKNRYVSQKEAF